MMMKQHLTPEEQLRVAYHHLILGVEQQVLSSIFMTNIGRVNDAVQIARDAFEFGPKKLTKEERAEMLDGAVDEQRNKAINDMMNLR